MEQSPPRGVFPVLPTIFHADGAIDDDGVSAVLEYVLAAGADGVVFPGLASEYDHLSFDERQHLVDTIGRRLNGRASFIVGASADSLDEAVLYARQGQQAGACAAMVMAPDRFADDMDAMSTYFAGLSEQTAIPIMVQNAPRPMGAGLPVEVVIKIVHTSENVRYVKEETAPCGQRISALRRDAGEAFGGVFGGAGGRQIIDEMNRGSLGTMPASEITEVHVAMVAAYRRGDKAAARTFFERSLPLLTMQAIFRWRLTKDVLVRRGLITSAFVRAPGPKLDDEDRLELSALLERLDDLLNFDATVVESAA